MTRERSVYEGDIVSLVAPGEAGYLGVLANHAPLMTSLAPGKITIQDASGSNASLISTGNGFLEVRENNCLILLDSCKDSQ